VPQFSVIIPTYNREQLLAEAIRSVLDQTIDDFEIIVVNDGGNEPSVPDDPRIRILTKPNGGPASARNDGIRAAQGRYVTFLDDDDLYTPARLALGLKGMRDADVTACSKSYGTPASQDLKRFLNGSGFHAGQFTIDRTICPLFDESPELRLGSEDLEWMIRLLPLGVDTIDEVGYIMRVHPGAQLTDDVRSTGDGRVALFRIQRDFFRAHPEMVAYQWKWAAASALRQGKKGLARRYFWRAFRAVPSVRNFVWLLRTVMPHSSPQEGSATRDSSS
jgi:glycosyltransferase involved in cell wall biosynthesis